MKIVKNNKGNSKRNFIRDDKFNGKMLYLKSANVNKVSVKRTTSK